MTAAPQPQANIEGIIHDLRASGDPTEEIWAYEIESLRTRISELEANERAYEEIIGKKTYREVADRIEELEAALRLARVAIRDESIEHAVVDTKTMQSLGSAIDAALHPKDDPTP
jgi:hypothetical protein